MKILVAGGLGFIGSHTVTSLVQNDYKVHIIDNLYNSKIEMLEKIEKITKTKLDFDEIDAKDYDKLKKVFDKNNFEAIINFAGYKAVGESVEKPLDYYENNIVSNLNLARLASEYKVKKFIFSSSATVYGDQISPMKEDFELLERTNPYAESKAMSEKILIDIAKSNPDLSVCLLRYFNPVGAHPSGIIGENPVGIPNNLFPYITRVAKGNLDRLNIFGDDYDTKDGTGCRDYIHVMDLANAHVKAVKNLKKNIGIYNIGNGKPISVLEIVEGFEKVNNIKIPYQIVDRRAGDIAVSFADPSLAERELDWKSEKTLDDMLRDSWNFEKNL